uniref:Junctophilin-3 n=1 Tax=Plectus sambesii TaxID=2011161 RepID=A0A914VI51_9BILA
MNVARVVVSRLPCRPSPDAHADTAPDDAHDAQRYSAFFSGTYQGQWLRGMRHGYGVRKSAPYGVAAKFRSRSHAHASLTSLRSEQGDDLDERPGANRPQSSGGDESRGGFVLRACSEPPQRRRRSLSERSLAVKRTILTGLRIKKQHSTGDIHTRSTNATGSIRSSGSTMSCTSDESGEGGHRSTRDDIILPPEEHIEPNTTECYMGEWKNDKRSGFGVSERLDGLKYEGEWFNNKKYGYGVTTLKDGQKEEGKYKNNVLVSSHRRKGLMFVRSSKLKERTEASVNAAIRAAQIAQQKSDIAVSRTATAKDRAEQADYVSSQSREDAGVARIHAKQFDPNFLQPGTENLRQRQRMQQNSTTGNHVMFGHSPPIRTSTPQQISFDEGVVGSAGGRMRGPVHQDSSASSGRPAPDDYDGDQHQAAAHYADEYYGASQASAHHPTAYVQSSASSSSANQLPGQPTISVQQHHEQVVSGVGMPPNAGAAHHADHHYSPTPNEPYSSSSSTIPNNANAAARLVMDEGPGTSGQRPRAPTNSSLQQQQQMQLPGGHVAFLETDRPQQLGVMAQSSLANQSQSSSRMSLNDDHFDQYMMAANPAQAKLIKNRGIQPNRPSLRHQPDAVSDIGVASSQLTRRSTLASSRDYRGPALPFDSPLTKPADDSTPLGLLSSTDEPRGSLPNLTDLDQIPLHMRREEAARLASQQRQELPGIMEEHELLRSNPLRYLFHPAVRAWIVRWKLPLVLAAANVCLLLVFYQLLTYQKSGARGHDES